MTDIDFEKFEILSEEEKKKVAADWTDEEWFNYFASKGTISLEEFRAELKKAAHKVLQEKYKKQTSSDIPNSIIAECFEKIFTDYLNNKYQGKFKAEEHPESKS